MGLTSVVRIMDAARSAMLTAHHHQEMTVSGDHATGAVAETTIETPRKSPQKSPHDAAGSAMLTSHHHHQGMAVSGDCATGAGAESTRLRISAHSPQQAQPAQSPQSEIVPVGDAGSGAQAQAQAQALDPAEKRLLELGYRQELKRRLGWLEIFGVSAAVMNPYMTAVPFFGFALLQAGPVGVVWPWVVLAPFALCMVLVIAEVCSSFPVSFLPRESVSRRLLHGLLLRSLLRSAALLGVPQLALPHLHLAPPRWIRLLRCSIHYCYLKSAASSSSGAQASIIHSPRAPIRPHCHRRVRSPPLTRSSPPPTSRLVKIDHHTVPSFPSSPLLSHSPRHYIAITIVTTIVITFAITIAITIAGDYHTLYVAGCNSFMDPVVHLFISVFTIRFGSATGAYVLLLLMVLHFYAAGFGVTLASSRAIYAASRDGAMPWSRVWRTLSRRNRIPVRAIWLSTLIAVVFGIPSFFSPTFFGTVAAVTSAAWLGTYGIVVFFRLIIPPHHFKPGPFSLGCCARPLCVVALGYIVYTIGVFMVPIFYPITWETFNYAPIAALMLMSFVLLWWTVDAHR
ncbi:unnamed protein product, partial [Closterium sp. NIES-54]